MGLPQIPPGGGRERAYLHVPYVSTKKGHPWRAWIAGPCHWYSCHTSSRTKPCVHDMTGGELVCSICSPTKTPQVIGYQPLYRELDGRPVHVIVYAAMREYIDRRKFHQNVLVARGPEVTDTVYIDPILSGGTRYESTLPERHRPICLDQVLLRMWNIPALTDWYNRTQGASVPIKEESDTPVSLDPDVKPLTPGINGWIGRTLGDKAEQVTRYNKNADFAARAKKAEQNGKHTTDDKK